MKRSFVSRPTMGYKQTRANQEVTRDTWRPQRYVPVVSGASSITQSFIHGWFEPGPAYITKLAL